MRVRGDVHREIYLAADSSFPVGRSDGLAEGPAAARSIPARNVLVRLDPGHPRHVQRGREYKRLTPRGACPRHNRDRVIPRRVVQARVGPTSWWWGLECLPGRVSDDGLRCTVLVVNNDRHDQGRGLSYVRGDRKDVVVFRIESHSVDGRVLPTHPSSDLYAVYVDGVDVAAMQA